MGWKGVSKKGGEGREGEWRMKGTEGMMSDEKSSDLDGALTLMVLS